MKRRVRKDLTSSDGLTPTMLEFCGKDIKIDSSWEACDPSDYGYFGEDHYWKEEWLDPVIPRLTKEQQAAIDPYLLFMAGYKSGDIDKVKREYEEIRYREES